MNKAYKRYIPPDKGWNIADSKRGLSCGRRKTHQGKNAKVYWLNVFNRKLRKFFNKMIKEEE